MTILEEIYEVKKEEIKKLKQDFTLSRFQDSEFFEKPKLSFNKAITNDDRISIIAEIKKASPSKGIIREKFNHLEIAYTYMENEVEAISILTDVNFFKGNLNYLRDIAKIKSVPLLRKDFIIDEYQIFEAKSNGADVILLIAELLSSAQINELTEAAKENDLEVLLELHSLDEIKKVNFAKNEIIGINNRDLKSFEVDIKTTEIISKNLPDNVLVISESGIRTSDDVDFIKRTKAKAILVGEHLMKNKNISDSVKRLKDWCSIES